MVNTGKGLECKENRAMQGYENQNKGQKTEDTTHKYSHENGSNSKIF